MLIRLDRRSSNLDLASRIDHTILQPEARGRDVHRVVAEAIEHGFASVCVNGTFVSDVARALHGTGVKTCAVVGFPLGASKATMKTIEATVAVKDSASEIDFVAHLPHLLNKNWLAAKAEFLDLVRAVRSIHFWEARSEFRDCKSGFFESSVEIKIQ